MIESRPSLRVWDPLVRVLHWTLAISVALAWVTRTGFGRWHEAIGYVSLAAVGVRIVWGAAGPRYAKFRQFVRSPAAGLRYIRLVLQRRAPRYIGHNPLGGWMVLALIASTAAVGLTGWLYTTDAYWGEEWLEALHDACAKVSRAGCIACDRCGCHVATAPRKSRGRDDPRPQGAAETS